MLWSIRVSTLHALGRIVNGTLFVESVVVDYRFLQLDGMTLSEVRQVEEHYLRAAKWPWNKMLNGNALTHPEWQNRLLLEDVCMLGHMSEYGQDTRRKQGLARLGLQQCVSGLQDQEIDVDTDFDSDAAACTDADTDVEAESEDLQSDCDDEEERHDSLCPSADA